MREHTLTGGVSRTHDSNGNLADDGTYLFGYDFENRLVEVRLKATQALVAAYRYDALGRRVEKAVVGGATTRYVLDGVEVIEEYDGSDLWQARYVYEDGIDRPRCMDRADIADVDQDQNTAEVLRFTYHQQALGSVTEITAPAGGVVEWVTYDVYGQPTIRNAQGNVVPASPVGNPYLFTGREYDAETGLYFFRARTYDPATGRFLQRDQLGFVDGMCLHEGMRSAPTQLRDPLGHYSWRDAEDEVSDARERIGEEERNDFREIDRMREAGDRQGLGRLWKKLADLERGFGGNVTMYTDNYNEADAEDAPWWWARMVIAQEIRDSLLRRIGAIRDAMRYLDSINSDRTAPSPDPPSAAKRPPPAPTPPRTHPAGLPPPPIPPWPGPYWPWRPFGPLPWPIDPLSGPDAGRPARPWPGPVPPGVDWPLRPRPARPLGPGFDPEGPWDGPLGPPPHSPGGWPTPLNPPTGRPRPC